MEKKLTEGMIRDKINREDISSLTELTFFANGLEDVSILSKLPNINSISFSHNKIATLAYFKDCTNLKELFLRKNKIESLKEIQHLKNLPCLRVLWLWDNPLSNHPLYRLYIIKVLPKLKKLDSASVSEEERMAAK